MRFSKIVKTAHFLLFN